MGLLQGYVQIIKLLVCYALIVKNTLRNIIKVGLKTIKENGRSMFYITINTIF